MRIIEKEKLDRILAEHKKWLNTRFTEKVEGECANLRDANLRDANLSNADLSYANLRDANLRDANLCNADLCNANLCYANLRDADLSYANLCYANLRDADLSYANLRDANLRDANLRDADLSYADLSYANLCNADLCDANLCNANLCYANLRNAENIGQKQADFTNKDLDFCSIPLSCRGLQWKLDKRIMSQLAYHFCSHECEDEEVKQMQNLLLPLANQFHRVNECGKLEPKK